MVLAGGGYDGAIGLSSAELYDSGILAPTKVNGQGSIDASTGAATFNFHSLSG
jgi:hypothetical protein